MIVKICGITRLEDAQRAVDLGASAIGFIFWPKSPRAIDPYRAGSIVSKLPPFVTAVGVFVNQPESYINAVALVARLTAVQLHGDETPDIAGVVSRSVIKAVSTVDDATARWPAHVTLLVDAHDPARRGGTGATADWDAAARLARQRRVLLAGGLRPDNVADAIRTVRPFGIDVSSGVESAPGIKDHERLAALFSAVHAS